jgi:hypothetical protein
LRLDVSHRLDLRQGIRDPREIHLERHNSGSRGSSVAKSGLFRVGGKLLTFPAKERGGRRASSMEGRGRRGKSKGKY